ncbi:MAG: desulfoferrodoxin [Candidatus Omnitrophota bacterium]|nr:desulfoferrodoxin [Candidatus Omnitrophota bacterium]MBU2528669.1 desulfoferrodoxin [bacterium]MBU3929440.1 desulfoferrodoxin [bacterium]
MIKRFDVFKCGVCGNIVELVYAGGGQLVCCEKPMILMEAKTRDEGKEKHVPVIVKTETGVLVKVGDVPHPMEEKHYILCIEVIADGRICRKFLAPGDRPEAEFKIGGGNLIAREYCTVHGLWKN